MEGMSHSEWLSSRSGCNKLIICRRISTTKVSDRFSQCWMNSSTMIWDAAGHLNWCTTTCTSFQWTRGSICLRFFVQGAILCFIGCSSIGRTMFANRSTNCCCSNSSTSSLSKPATWSALTTKLRAILRPKSCSTRLRIILKTSLLSTRRKMVRFPLDCLVLMNAVTKIITLT